MNPHIDVTPQYHTTISASHPQHPHRPFAPTGTPSGEDPEPTSILGTGRGSHGHIPRPWRRGAERIGTLLPNPLQITGGSESSPLEVSDGCQGPCPNPPRRQCSAAQRVGSTVGRESEEQRRRLFTCQTCARTCGRGCWQLHPRLSTPPWTCNSRRRTHLPYPQLQRRGSNGPISTHLP